MTCLAVRADATGERYVCAREDPHLAAYGSDSEGHAWRRVGPEEWRAAYARLEQDQARDAEEAP